MEYSIIAIALLVVFYFRYRKANRKGQELIKVFENHQAFIGKDLEYIVSKAGYYTFYGSMDHGNEIAQWKSGRTIIEVVFKNGICVAINDK
jgi:hypothetical protein